MPRCQVLLNRLVLRSAPILLLVACAHWEPYSIPGAGGPLARLPSTLRVTAAESTSSQVVDPYVSADTLYGTSRGDTVAHALGTIRALERQRLDPGRTIAAVGGGLAVWVTLAFLGGGLDY